MRVNSDETLRRAAAYRETARRSWLQLSRLPVHQRRSREFFSGGRNQDEAARDER